MADQRPLNPQNAPDPATTYERARPERESGQGRLDNNTSATPENAPDRQEETVKNRQEPRQINAEDVVNDRAQSAPGESTAAIPAPSQPQPDHSMQDEEPNGWDQAPSDIHDPRHQRHPRREGKGGTP